MKVKKVKDILTDVFSFSKLMAFSKCPRYAFYRYVARLKRPSEDYFLQGRGTHAGQEYDNLERIAGRRPKREEILDCAVNAYIEEGGQAIDPFRHQHEKQLEKYWTSGDRDRLVPEPGSVEAPFEIDVAVTADPSREPLVPATIQGFVDVVSLEDERRTIVDYKTVGRPVSDKEARESLQNHLYMLGAETDRAQNVSFVKEGRQKAGCKTTSIVQGSAALFQRLITVIGDTIASFRKNCKSGDWPKCSPSCFWCGPGLCEFYPECYPEKNPHLHEWIALGEVRPVGTLDKPEWWLKKREKKEKKEEKES